MNQVLASAAQTPPNKSDIIKYARIYAEVYNARGSWLIRKVAQYQLLDTISARYQLLFECVREFALYTIEVELENDKVNQPSGFTEPARKRPAGLEYFCGK